MTRRVSSTRNRSVVAILVYDRCQAGAQRLRGTLATDDQEIAATSEAEEAQIHRMAQEFEAVLDHAPDCDKPMLHFSLSLDPSDRKLTHTEWSAIVEDFLGEMGCVHHQYTATRHPPDPQHPQDHVHVCLNRIDPRDYEPLDLSHINYRAQAYCRRIEAAMNLTQIPSGWERKEQRATPDGLNRQQRKALAQGETPPLVQLTELRKQIDEASQGQPLMSVLRRRLGQVGVQMRVTLCGDEVGLSYGVHTGSESPELMAEPIFRVQSNQLGAAYTFEGLQKYKGVVFDPELDPILAEPLRPRRFRPPTTREAALKAYLGDAIALTLEGQPTLNRWLARLEEWQIQVELRYAKSTQPDELATPTVIRYQVGDEAVFAGTELRQGHTFKALRARGLRYTPTDAAQARRPLQGTDQPLSGKAALTKAEAKAALQPLLEAALGLTDTPPLATYLTRLQQKGVGVTVRFRQGRPYGLTYRYAGYYWPASQLATGDRKYTLKALQHRGSTYEATQKPTILALNQQAPVLLSPELERLAKQLRTRLAGKPVLLNGEQILRPGGTAYKARQAKRFQLQERIDAAIADVFHPITTAFNQLEATIATTQTSLKIQSTQEPLVAALKALQRNVLIARGTMYGADANLLPEAVQQIVSGTAALSQLPTYNLHQTQKHQIITAIQQAVAVVEARSQATTLADLTEALKRRGVEAVLARYGVDQHDTSGITDIRELRGIRYRRTEDAPDDTVPGQALTLGSKGYTLPKLLEQGIHFTPLDQNLAPPEKHQLQLHGVEPTEPTREPTPSPFAPTPDTLNQMLRQAWELFLLNYRYGELEHLPPEEAAESTSHVWRLSTPPYTLTYDLKRDRLTVTAAGRGLLLRGAVYADDVQSLPMIQLSQHELANAAQQIIEAEQSVFAYLRQAQVRELTQADELSRDAIEREVSQAATQLRQTLSQPTPTEPQKPPQSRTRQLSLLDYEL